MPTPRRGTAYRDGDHWVIRATLRNGKKTKPIHLDPSVTEKQARAKAARLAELSADPNAVLVGDVTRADLDTRTVGDWIEDWFRSREDKGITSVPDDRGRWSKWLAPRLARRPLARVTKSELEDVVEDLDTKVRAGKLSAGTAKNVWALVSSMFRDASRSKVRALRVREDNPARDVAPPDRGTKKSKSWLWPAEMTAVLDCLMVPIRWRRLMALAAYTYTREGELEALEWSDVDFAEGIIHIHRAIERRKGEAKCTKTNAPRRIPIEASLRPLLEVMSEDATSERVIDVPPAGDLAKGLRMYLQRAGVTRAELFANDATRKQLGWHDLRATGITWMALRGDSPMLIMARAGHKDFKTTLGYIREAEVLGSRIGEPFAPLPPSLLHRTADWTENAATWGQAGAIIRRSEGVPSGIRKLSGIKVSLGKPGVSTAEPVRTGVQISAENGPAVRSLSDGVVSLAAARARRR